MNVRILYVLNPVSPFSCQEAELESIRMQSTLEQLKEEKGRLQNSILEAE